VIIFQKLRDVEPRHIKIKYMGAREPAEDLNVSHEHTVNSLHVGFLAVAQGRYRSEMSTVTMFTLYQQL